MADHNHTEKPFPFFELPRELRDYVYDELKCAYNIADKGSLGKELLLDVFVVTLVPHARLINRQFKEEAECQARKQMTLTLEDYTREFGHELAPLPLWVLETTTAVSISLMAYCHLVEEGDVCDAACPAGIEIVSHKEWVEDLLKKMSTVKSICVEIYVEWDDNDRQRWPNAAHGPNLISSLNDFVGMDKLQLLKVYKELEGDEKLWVKWDKQNAWQAPDTKDNSRF